LPTPFLDVSGVEEEGNVFFDAARVTSRKHYCCFPLAEMPCTEGGKQPDRATVTTSVAGLGTR
jgi:hypothetical protein